MDAMKLAMRTSGDGMEAEKVKVASESVALVKDRSTDAVEPVTIHAIKPQAQLLPKGKVYNLIPRLVPPMTTPNTATSFAKVREPRFVPFEPYKAAVTPILDYDKQLQKKSPRTRKNTNVDLNALAKQIAENTKSEMDQGHLSSLKSDNHNSSHSPLNSRQSEWELKYEEMRREKEYFEKQLKFQTQVNSELKNLLIAAVGEDLQTRVNVLTEDKLQLARALLDSSNHLTSHTEQIEYLAGQSEVWRSKFLASSLMVEELARWKTALLEKNRHLIGGTTEMLKTMAVLREMQTEVLKNLHFLSRNRMPLQLPTANCIDLAKEGVNISQQLTLIDTSVGVPLDLPVEKLPNLTPAEQMLMAALELNQQKDLVATDDPFKAVVGQAFPSMTAMREQRAAAAAEHAQQRNDHDQEDHDQQQHRD